MAVVVVDVDVVAVVPHATTVTAIPALGTLAVFESRIAAAN